MAQGPFWHTEGVCWLDSSAPFLHLYLTSSLSGHDLLIEIEEYKRMGTRSFLKHRLTTGTLSLLPSIGQGKSHVQICSQLPSPTLRSLLATSYLFSPPFEFAFLKCHISGILICSLLCLACRLKHNDSEIHPCCCTDQYIVHLY